MLGRSQTSTTLRCAVKPFSSRGDLLEAEGACLDEYGIQNLLLHLKIAASRIRSGRVLTDTDTVPQDLWQLASAMTQTAGRNCPHPAGVH